MISLTELLMDNCTTPEPKENDIDSTFTSFYDSSLSNDFNLLRHSTLTILKSRVTEITHTDEIYNTDFDDNDSGLGDSTPPSPTWTNSDDSEEIDHRMENITDAEQDSLNDIFHWELQHQPNYKGNIWRLNICNIQDKNNYIQCFMKLSVC